MPAAAPIIAQPAEFPRETAARAASGSRGRVEPRGAADWQFARRALRFASGAVFAAIGAGLLFQEDDVHILMCGLGALGFGAGQVWASLSGRRAKAASFFAGWMLVYTVWMGSAMLVLIPELRAAPEPMAWAYHVVVTAVLACFFAFARPHTPWALGGIWSALVSTPFMLYLVSVQPFLTLDDPRPLIPVCALAGAALLLAHVRSAAAPIALARQLPRLRRVVLHGLALYGLATLGTFVALS